MSYSQDKSKTLGLQDYVYEYTLGASDTVSNNDTLWSAELLTNKIAPLLYNIKVKLTKVSGTPKSTVYLQGKLFSDDTWVNITSLTYGGTTADTTIVISNTTANRYRYFKILVSRTAGTFKVTDSQFKLWYE
jgi:hypothetical protein